MQTTTFIPGQDDLVEEVLASFPAKGSIIDIGTGSGLAARRFFEAGWEVTATGFDMQAYYKDGDGLPEGIKVLPDLDVSDMCAIEDGAMDAVWCAHVLEHVLDTGRALAEIRRILKPGGWLFVAVPPFKHNIVGGHVHTGWNIGTLMYDLADSGFGLYEGRFVRHGYNIFGMVQRGPGPLSKGKLHRANGDLEILCEAGRFPKNLEVKQGFNGDLPAVNWKWNRAPTSIEVARSMLASPGPAPKMRIGFFVPRVTQGCEGTENVGHMMVNAMAARGHTVVIYTLDSKSGSSLSALEDSIELVHLSESSDEVADQLMVLDIASRNLDLLVGIRVDCDCIRYVRCAQKVGLPIIFSTYLGPGLPETVGVSPPADNGVVALAGATLIHVQADALVSTFPNFLKQRIRVIPNTVSEPEVLAEPGREKVTKYLLTVSPLDLPSNTLRLVEAFAELVPDFPSWKLRIVGSGSEENVLRDAVKRLGIEGKVDFKGFQGDLSFSYHEADIFATSSIVEELSPSVYEAFSYGIPVVGYEACSSLNEKVVYGENGFLAQGGHVVGTLADEIKKLMENRELRKEMGQAARKTFLANFSDTVIHSAWEDMLVEAIEIGPILLRPTEKAMAETYLIESVWGTEKQRVFTGGDE